MEALPRFRQSPLFTLLVALTWALALWLVLPVRAAPPIGANSAAPCSARVARTGRTFASSGSSALQQAVDAARDGDLIRVAGYCAGVRARGGVTQTVYITKRLTLRGGYTPADWTASNAAAHPTTLDALGLGRVVFITATPGVTLADLTVTNGRVATTAPLTADVSVCPTGCGGGVYASAGLALRDVDFIDNAAGFAGGGAYVRGTATLIGGLFERNQSRFHGGGLTVGGIVRSAPVASAALTLNGTRFIGNEGGDGGAVSAYCPAAVTGARFEDNRGSLGGGFAGGAPLELRDSQFIGNSAVEAGGAYIASWSTLSRVRFENNESRDWGGGLGAENALTVTESSFVGNSASAGGAMYAANWDGPLAVMATVFLSNTARSGWGGAVNFALNHAQIVDSLFAHNTAAGAGAALYCLNPSYHGGGSANLIYTTIVGNGSGDAISAGMGTVGITDTIITGYSTPISAAIGASVSEDYNLFFETGTAVGAVTHGGHSLIGDPGFANSAADNYHPASGSPAIDAAVDTGVYTDLDGLPRPWCGGGFDIGAFQSHDGGIPSTCRCSSAARRTRRASRRDDRPGRLLQHTPAIGIAGG